MSRKTIQDSSFLVVMAIVTAAFVWLLTPYYGAILWAVILAILFHPLQHSLETLLNGRRNTAAALSVLACVCIVVIPGSMVLISLAQEATGLYTRLSARELDLGTQIDNLWNLLPHSVLHLFSAMDLNSATQFQARLTSFALQASQTIASSALSIGHNTAQFVISLGVMLYLLFFLFRDGVVLTSLIRKASPLSASHTEHILDKFKSVIRATVKGNVIIAAIQGAIGGVTFWMLGLEPALLWAVLMGVLSLLPLVGAGLIWMPAAGYLLLSGQFVKGAILLAIGMLIMSMIDNLLRPPLVGKGTLLPDYAVLISTIGGLSLIGISGFVVGPLIAALFVAVWSLFAEESSQA